MNGEVLHVTRDKSPECSVMSMIKHSEVKNFLKIKLIWIVQNIICNMHLENRISHFDYEQNLLFVKST